MSGPNFDSIKHLNPYNVEYWQARELQPLLGYQRSWQNFEKVIEKAKVSCESVGNIVADHFNDAIKPIAGGKWHCTIRSFYGIPFYVTIALHPIHESAEM